MYLYVYTLVYVIQMTRTDTIKCTYLRIFHSIFHDFLPVSVYNLEESTLLWHLLHDVLGGEDGL